jgi:hypothetical protein
MALAIQVACSVPQSELRTRKRFCSVRLPETHTDLMLRGSSRRQSATVQPAR